MANAWILKKKWNMKVIVIQDVVVAFVMVSKALEIAMWELQSKMLLKSARNLEQYYRLEETFCLSNTSIRNNQLKSV